MEKFNLITNSAIDLGDNLEAESNGKGRKFVSRFIEAGVAHYEQFGDVLITKETLDKFINTMVGCPVIIKHKDITDENADKERVGVVSDVWYNEQDGYFYCSGIIWDKQAIDLVKNQGWNVSCTYDFESDKQAKTHNGKKIDMEFTDGNFLHLALVDNPRYERANIVMNSKVENEEHWITVGSEDGKKGTHILVKDGETNKEATERKVAEWESKDGKEDKKDKFPSLSREKLSNLDKNAEDNIKDKDKWLAFTKEKAEILGDKVILGSSKILKEKDFEEMDDIKIQKMKNLYEKYNLLDKQPKEEKKYESRHAEILYKDLPELREKLHKARYERAKNKEKGADVSLYDKRIKEYEEKEQQLKDEMAELRDSRRTQKERYVSLIEESKQKDKDKAQNALLNGLETILDDYKPVKEDLPMLNGLKDILE